MQLFGLREFNSIEKDPVPERETGSFSMAGSTGFEPAISSVTGRHVRPLHHEPSSELDLLARFEIKPFQNFIFWSVPPLGFARNFAEPEKLKNICDYS